MANTMRIHVKSTGSIALENYNPKDKAEAKYLQAEFLVDCGNYAWTLTAEDLAHIVFMHFKESKKYIQPIQINLDMGDLMKALGLIKRD